jgi:hypothetical protein
MKYALNRLALLSLQLVQAMTNLTQIEVVALGEASFFTFGEAKMFPC